MSDNDTSERPERGRSEGGGLLGTIARWLLAREAARVDAEPRDAEAAHDIVDQAEAFQSLRVADVMTPRGRHHGGGGGAPLGEVMRLFAEIEHSRLPVYRETLDDPVGVVHIKDMVKLICQPGADGGISFAPDWNAPVLGRLRREALYVPASMRAADLLLRMQSTRMHMALVIDEFGGVDGLATLEDLLEAVVGDIEDEHDIGGEPALEPRGPGPLGGRRPHAAADAGGRRRARPARRGARGGGRHGRGAGLRAGGPRAQRGEVITHPDGMEFEVLDADPRRIRRLRIRRTRPPEPGDAGLESGAT
jgi:CBS domain containing-hemolysin-like protein